MGFYIRKALRVGPLRFNGVYDRGTIELTALSAYGNVFPPGSSVLPEHTWRALRLKPERKADSTLAGGTSIERGVSECRFEIREHAATSPVVLGEGHDGALLGAVTLETLGLMLNPLTREILPMQMTLSRVGRSR